MPLSHFTQLQRRPNARYLDLQTDVNAKMRAILVDWLVEVAEEYKLCADTLYQAVNYADRFLSLHVAQRSQLQLIGVTCMWIAAKFEEIYPPNVSGESNAPSSSPISDLYLSSHRLLLHH
jgi:cyclin-A